MRILFGFILVGLGFLLVWKSEWLVKNFGRSSWAELHLGTAGGTRMLIKLIGILVIIIGFMAITGLHKGLLLWVFVDLFKMGSRPV